MSVTLEQMFSRHNLDGKVYRADVREWLGVDIPSEKFNELIDKFTELSEHYGQGSGIAYESL